MAENQGLLKKALGLFVELPTEELSATSFEDFPGGVPMSTPVEPTPAAAAVPAPTVTKSIEQIVREAEGPNIEEIKAEPTDALPPAPGGMVNFSEIYKRSNLPTVPFGAEQALEMLGSLPTDLPLETRRKTVHVTLGSMGRAMGVTVETVVADASRKLAAITTYADALRVKTSSYIQSTEAHIAQMQAEIEEKKREIESTKQMLASAERACSAESDRLDDVLEFFSLDVPPSKYAGS